MSNPDLEAMSRYVLFRLSNELAENLYYHGVHHTRDQVIPAVKTYARMEGVTREETLLLTTAAWFHDLGYVERYKNNEEIGAQIASQILPNFGYDEIQITVVCSLIMATCMPQRPKTRLEQILCDADLDHLGSPTFPVANDNLRREQNAYLEEMTEIQWYLDSISFLQKHTYFTKAARQMRDTGKQQNIAYLKNLL